MKYDPLNKEIKITTEEAKRAALTLLYAMKRIRIMNDIPLTKYDKDHSPLGDAELIQCNILDAAKYLGFDLGGEWPHQIDLTSNNLI